MSARRQHGFSLLELLIAFVVFALAFAALMQITVGSLRTARLSSEHTQAALWAQSKLDALGVGEALEEGSGSGRFDERFRWTLEVREEEAPLPASGVVADPVADVELYRVALTVHWGDGNAGREARFVTLRAVQPDLSRGTP